MSFTFFPWFVNVKLNVNFLVIFPYCASMVDSGLRPHHTYCCKDGHLDRKELMNDPNKGRQMGLEKSEKWCLEMLTKYHLVNVSDTVSPIFDLISSDEKKNIDFGSKLKEMVVRWHHEASINYGLSNIKRLMLPLLVLESPALLQKTEEEEDLLKAYDTSERRRQLLFYLNYTKEETCKRPLASKWVQSQNQSQTSCQVQEKCRKLCGKYFSKSIY